MPIQDKFASENPYVLTAKMQTADNNQTALNTLLDETLAVKATAVIFQPQGLTADVNNPVPTVTAVAQNTVGAALGGAGTAGAGGVPPCFVYATLISTPNGKMQIGDIEVGQEVYAFDKLENVIIARVIGKWEHLAAETLLVKFADGRVTHTTPLHRYWTGEGFAPIVTLDSVRHWTGEKWTDVKIVERTTSLEEMFVYNLTVDIYHTYFANDDAVSNVKRLPDPNELVE